MGSFLPFMGIYITCIPLEHSYVERIMAEQQNILDSQSKRGQRVTVAK